MYSDPDGKIPAFALLLAAPEAAPILSALAATLPYLAASISDSNQVMMNPNSTYLDKGLAGFGYLPVVGGVGGKSLSIINNATKGAEFERKVLTMLGEVKNNKILNNGIGDRIPDILNNKTIGEIKNVNYQSLTKQLKTFISESSKTGKQMNLYINQNTKISQPLKNALDSVKAVINKISN